MEKRKKGDKLRKFKLSLFDLENGQLSDVLELEANDIDLFISSNGKRAFVLNPDFATTWNLYPEIKIKKRLNLQEVALKSNHKKTFLLLISLLTFVAGILLIYTITVNIALLSGFFGSFVESFICSFLLSFMFFVFIDFALFLFDYLPLRNKAHWLENYYFSFSDLYFVSSYYSRLFFVLFFCIFGFTFGVISQVVCTNAVRSALGALGSAIILTVVNFVSFGVGLLWARSIENLVFESYFIPLGYAGLLIIVFPIFTILGSSRLIFYPFQLLQSLSKKHPTTWDELTVLALPGTRKLLDQTLQQNEATGLNFVGEMARNPFRRSVAQNALQSYLHQHPAPLHLLYRLLSHPDFQTYAIVPITKQDWEQVPTTGYLLLGELSGEWVDYSTDWANRGSERLLWYLTTLRRDRRQTPLTRFAKMLFHLLDEERVNAADFNLANYHNTYARLASYSGGEEIANTFAAIATFLTYDDLAMLPAAAEVVGTNGCIPLRERDAIRPDVITALTRLGEVGGEIATYQDSSSRVNQLAAIARATNTLDRADEFAKTEVFPPERAILRRIIRQWRKLVSEAGGEVGRAAIAEPVPNPYIAGNPVTGEKFVGREDILRRLEELWSKTEQCESVVLYGHRRMGKSSILKNLGARFGQHTAIVDFNMQGEMFVSNTGQLLYDLAIEIYDSLPPAQQQQLAEPQEKSFSSNPSNALRRFLKHLDDVRAGLRLIVAVDEFEILEKKIAEQKLDPDVLDFFRYLIQTHPWFLMAFAGLHTLREMCHDYWNPLFSSVTAIPVSFLSPAAARQLICQPNLPLEYDAEAVELIFNLTHGQPYLIQLIGRELVTRFNRQTFEEGVERERRFSVADVEEIASAPEFFRDGNAYFTGVWVQAETTEPEGQLEVLQLLHAQPLSVEELVRETAWSRERVEAALAALQHHDVILRQGERYGYAVELMRRWVARRG